jgi:hypothetical protein
VSLFPESTEGSVVKAESADESIGEEAEELSVFVSVSLD